jgi:hypothetical protein
VKNVCRRNNVAFVTIGLNIIPNGLSPTQRASFFLVVPNGKDTINFVYQWQLDPQTYVVAITYATFPTQTAVFLSINSQLLASSYSAIGYNADTSSFVSASINVGLSPAPDSLVIPSTTSAVEANTASGLNAVAFSRLSDIADRL